MQLTKNSYLWWISRIKDPTIREKAIDATNKQGSSEKIIDYFNLSTYFTWSDTPEGHDYWYKLNGSTIELLPEPESTTNLTVLPEKYQVCIEKSCKENIEKFIQWYNKKFGVKYEGKAAYYSSVRKEASYSKLSSDLPIIQLDDWIHLVGLDKSENKQSASIKDNIPVTKQNAYIGMKVMKGKDFTYHTDKTTEFGTIVEDKFRFPNNQKDNFVRVKWENEKQYSYSVAATRLDLYVYPEQTTNNNISLTNKNKQQTNEGNKITARNSVRINRGERPKGQCIKGRKVKATISVGQNSYARITG